VRPYMETPIPTDDWGTAWSIARPASRLLRQVRSASQWFRTRKEGSEDDINVWPKSALEVWMVRGFVFLRWPPPPAHRRLSGGREPAMRSRGFTLIELMIAIAIVAMLAGSCCPSASRD